MGVQLTQPTNNAKVFHPIHSIYRIVPYRTYRTQVVGERGAARRLAERYSCPRLGRACRLLDGLRKAVEFAEDAGMEACLPHLAVKAARLAAEEAAELAAEAAAAAAGLEGPPPPVLRSDGGAAAAPGMLGGGGGEDGGGAFLAQLRAEAEGLQLPSGAEVAAQLAAARAAAEGPQPGNRWVGGIGWVILSFGR